MTMTDTPLFGADGVINLDTARVRPGDPVTSHEAADSQSLMSLADSRTAVFLAFMHHGPMADNELVQRLADGGSPFTPSRIRTARHEMTEDGRLEFTGFFHLTESGRRAQVWGIPESGDAA